VALDRRGLPLTIPAAAGNAMSRDDHCGAQRGYDAILLDVDNPPTASPARATTFSIALGTWRRRVALDTPAAYGDLVGLCGTD